VPADLTNVVAIAGGGFHSLALLANGTVVVWGDNTYGQTNMPADLTNVVAIVGGGFHSLALRANGTVVAWGLDTAGQTNAPADLTNVVAVAGGYRHSLALENDGSPFIVRQPASQTTSTNSTVTFTVIALGAPALSYQWQKNGSNLIDGGNASGSTSAALTLTNVQAADAAGYTVVITNAIGSVTSSNALLTVTNIPPAITQQPADQTVAVGSNVTFSVYAIGTPPLSYQWQLNGTNLVDGGNITNSTTTNLIISNVQLTDDGGNYTVIVTNLAGSVTSSNAVLTVTTNTGLFIMQPINQKVAPLSFANIVAAPGSGGGFILSGAGGVTNGTYYVLISTNLLLPLTNWTSIATNQFDSEGDFIFTNTAQTNVPQLFYLLQLP
jgi:hypothetical protein